ncbi:MAG: 2-amino-4-hydroxy-6-hydroxymethyldihydropteridine diphosphokinase [Muribaculaceae bacterium]|nr:2-amino-4-hydroxy-6-hydroxymethyldihydropteridine diphosphokinase [Muribaculaceae bacterium]
MTFSEHTEPTEAIVCIGANCGDRKRNVCDGLRWLSGILSGFRHSSVYFTQDCHGSQKVYMNAVGVGYTCMHTLELERNCKEYELACGRDSEARAVGDVPVDIDLVVFGGEVLREKDYRSEFFLKGYREIKDILSDSSD